MEKINKVAEVSFLFWLMKIFATTLGKTMGNYIVQTLDLFYTIVLIVTMVFFLLMLAVQLHAKKHISVFYWLVIIATSALGTDISDFVDRSWYLGYTIGSLFLYSGSLLTLLLWHKKFKNLNVYPITDRNKEIYYWVAIVFSNSLGAAFGDYLSDVIGLSYINGAFFTTGIILTVVLLHYGTKVNHIILFWVAFIFTRPFGASFGDLLTKAVAKEDWIW
jgi:uncharacterized membrane-anchored protein